MYKIYTGKCNIIGFENYDPVGELVVAYSLDELNIKHYYIREWYFENFFTAKYNDFKVDKDSLIDITDYNNPVKFLGIDLSNSSDITFRAGDYIINE